MRLEGMACHHLCLQFLGRELRERVYESLRLTRAGSKEMPSLSPQQAGAKQLHHNTAESIVWPRRFASLARGPLRLRRERASGNLD